MSPQRLLILAILLYIGWRLVRSLIRESIMKELEDGQAGQPTNEKTQDILVEDPVCHTLIPRHEAIRQRHNGITYYFCSEACCDKFNSNLEGTTEQ